MAENPNYYAVLPAEVRYDKKLKPLEKLLYAEITALSNKEGFCWASNQYFADLYDRSAKRISEILNDLQERGYLSIEVDQAAGNARKIRIAIPTNRATYPEKNGYPYPEKSGHNNKTMNTKKNTKTISKEVEQQATELAETLAAKVTENFEFAKTDAGKWAADIEKLHRLDGYEYQLIEAVILWSQQDSFWRQNIRSGATLRKQFETLLVRIKTEQQKKVSNGLIDADAIIEANERAVV